MMQLHDRHTTNESFTITCSSTELDQVWQALVAMHSNEAEGQRVWLVGDGARRMWVLPERTTTVWIASEGSPKDPPLLVPFTPHLIWHASMLADETGECQIALDAVHGVITVSNEHQYHCVDHEPDVEFDPDWHPASHEPGATAVISALVHSDALHRLSRSLRLQPWGTSIEGVPPFVALEMTGESLRATIDWRRCGGGRYTHVVPTAEPVLGSGRVSFLGFFAVRYLTDRLLGGDEMIRVWFSEHEPTVIRFDAVDSEWGCIVRLDRESAMRWHGRVCAELESAGCIIGGRAERPTNSIIAHFGRLEFSVLIEPGDSVVNDRVRVAVALATGVALNVDTLREMNAFNLRWSDVKVVLDDATLFGIVDVPCTDLERIGDAVRLLAERHIDLSPMLAMYS